MLLNILNVPQLKLVCFATIRLIREVSYCLRPQTYTVIHQQRSMELAAIFVGKLIGGDVIKIRRE